jgi:hypothetical protein
MWERSVEVRDLNEVESGVEREGGSAMEEMSARQRLALVGNALLRRREVIAAVSALVGLGIGVVVGRESTQGAVATSQSDRVTTDKVSTAKGRLAAAQDKDRQQEIIDVPGPEYRRELGRRLPKASRGLEQLSLPGRRVAQIVDKAATVPFELDAVPDSSYALTAVVYVEGGKKAELMPELDGRPLSRATLGEGWTAYHSPVPKELLAERKHELTLRLDPPAESGAAEKGGAKSALVAVDSVAVAPVSKEVSFDLGPQAVGSLIEGFSKPSKESAWSEGNRSVLGVVLAPEPTDYTLTVRAGALSRLAPLTVTAKVNESELGTAVFAKKATESSWRVPAKAMKPGLNRIEFSYPQTASPSEYNPESQDKRLLALRFYRVALQPVR